MGAKTAILAISDGDPADRLRAAGQLDPARTSALVSAAYPDWNGETTDGTELFYGVYPPEGTVYAGSFPGIDILCDRDVMVDRPHELPQRYRDLAAGRTMILHAMHSVNDFLAFALWRDATLVRSLSLCPDGGIIENTGTPFAFEGAYWAGEHPAGGSYPLPFHPLEFGEDALRALLGFIIEGVPLPGDVDAKAVPLSGFRVRPASRITQDQMEEFLRTHRRTTYRLGPGGTLIREDG